MGAAPKKSFFGPDQPPLEKWETAFRAFVERAAENGARQRWLAKQNPSRMRRARKSLSRTFFGPSDAARKREAECLKAREDIFAFYRKWETAFRAFVDRRARPARGDPEEVR